MRTPTIRTTPIRAMDEISLPYPPAAVWPVIADVAGYVHWWPRSLHLRVISGGTEPLGTDVELRPSAGRAFRCRVDAIDAPSRMLMRYHGGFLAGTGEWRLDPAGSETRVVYTLDVHATGRVVAVLAKFLDLGRLHSKSMRAVLANLREEVARRRARGDPTPNA